MIKENSLRLGNKVWQDGKIATVSSLLWEGNESKLTIIGIDGGIERFLVTDLQPIPLNDEWFADFGFNNTNGILHSIPLPEGIEGAKVTVNAIVVKNSEMYYFTFNAYWGEKRFKYVHELQNLFFAIADEDLVFKKVNIVI